MPENPEIRRIVDILRSRLKGEQLLFINWMPNTKYSAMFDQYGPWLNSKLPLTCLDILSRGKQIFFFFENGLSFISGLGMEGHWYYFKTSNVQNYLNDRNYRMFCLQFGKRIQRNGVEWNIADTEIWYDDKRHFGNFTITDWNGAFNKMKEIGTDLLAATHPIQNIHPIIQKLLPPEFFKIATLQDFTLAIRVPRRAQMLLHTFLLDHQEVFSGIGNYLRAEIMYRARLHPNRTLGSLSDKEIEVLFSNCLTTISQAYQYGGLTHGTFLDPDMQKGTFSVQVYKKEGQLDPNGYVIKRIKVKNDRSIYLVEEVQK